jgi:hypothetical protein
MVITGGSRLGAGSDLFLVAEALDRVEVRVPSVASLARKGALICR